MCHMLPLSLSLSGTLLWLVPVLALPRVSVVGVAAEVFVLKRAAEVTGGTYGVALSEAHLQELMMQHAPPPAASGTNAGAELVGGRLGGGPHAHTLAHGHTGAWGA